MSESLNRLNVAYNGWSLVCTGFVEYEHPQPWADNDVTVKPCLQGQYGKYMSALEHERGAIYIYIYAPRHEGISPTAPRVQG